MPIYEYEHPETGEIFTDLRSISKRDNPYVTEEGVECQRVKFPSSVKGWRGDRESFEIDADYVRKCNPKYVKFRDGHREKYDPNRHF